MLTATFIHDGPAPERLDAAIARRFPHLSRPLIRRGIARHAATLNHRPAPKGALVHPGDTITLVAFPEPADELPRPNPGIPLALLYEDAHLLAFHKPAGLPCHPNSPGQTDTLANAILHRWPHLCGIGDTPFMCGLLHRIDTATSGILLAAQTPGAYTLLRRQFTRREVCKTYHAVVRGIPPSAATLQHTLAHHPRKPGHIVDAAKWWNARHPMHALTALTPLRTLLPSEGFPTPAALVQATIHTGVTHQIRCQLALAGHPIFGDDRYGGPPLPPALAAPLRHLLHASSITFQHPATGAGLTLTAPLPSYFPALQDEKK